MRRPTSDIRQRESRRSSLDNVGSRRRNSSVPFHSARIERNPNSLDSDTDFLCDRAVEFMESGDIHSIVAVELAEQSMYFERLLRYHKGRGYIRLPEFLNSGFSSVLDFIRKGTTDITAENVYHIFIAADYLLVPKLKQECANLLKDVANDPATAISLWLSCRSLYWPEVGAMAFQKMLENFETVWPSQDFSQLEAADVWRILREDGLNCKRERHVFDAIHQWINVAPKTRLPFALELLTCVRLGMLAATDFELIKNNEMVNTIPEYANLLADWPRCLTDQQNPIIAACAKQFVTPRLPHEVVMVFGGWCDGEGPRAAAQVFNPRSNTWTLWTEAGAQAQPPLADWAELALPSPVELPSVEMQPAPPPPLDDPLPPSSTDGAAQEVANSLALMRTSLTPDGPSAEAPTDATVSGNAGNLIGEIPRRVYAGCVLVGTRVYLVGGFDGTNALKSTLCYDFEIDSGWYEISCMYEKRYYVSVAHAVNHIYALGGHNGENQGRLDSAERYTLEENLWQTIASMNRIRSDAASAELGGRVYVAGGFEGRRYHDSAEYYDAEANQWTLISRMHSPRGGISLAQQGGYLYAIGGNDGNSRLRTIERYDSTEGRWELIGQMNRRKSNLSSTVVNDDIYILGGWSDEPEAGILDLVERFDTTTRECHVLRSLNFPASATCACTLKDRNLVRKYLRPVTLPNSLNNGPQFGLFLTQNTNTPDVVANNNNQSSTTFPATIDGPDPSITGQRNTNNQPASLAVQSLSINKTLIGTNCLVDSYQSAQTSTHALTRAIRAGSSPMRAKRRGRDAILSDHSTSERTASVDAASEFEPDFEDTTQSDTEYITSEPVDSKSLKSGYNPKLSSGTRSHHTHKNRRLRSPLCSAPKRSNAENTGRQSRTGI